MIVRQADDRAALELALIENSSAKPQPVGRGAGYAQLVDQFQLIRRKFGKVGKSRAGRS